MPGGQHEHPGFFGDPPQLDPGGGDRRAAAVKLFSSATATKYLRCRNSMSTIDHLMNGA
jgi:hypothetical protein